MKKKKQITCHDHEGNLLDFSVDQLSFRPSVYGILLKGNKVLLSRQWDGYDFPGGGVNIDETIEQALEREFFEEAGLKVKVGKVVYCQTSFFFTRRSRKAFNAIVIYCLCEEIGGKLSIDNLEEVEKEYISLPEWVNIKSLNKLKFYNPVNSPKVVKQALLISKRG